MSNQSVFSNEADFTDEWLAEVDKDSQSIYNMDESTIENEIDRRFTNPEFVKILEELDNRFFEEDDNEQEANFSSNEMQKAIGRPRSKKSKFKEKIRKVFCKVVGKLDIERAGIKGVIQSTLIALIPAFVSGIPAIALPVIIAIIIHFMKKGISNVCPV